MNLIFSLTMICAASASDRVDFDTDILPVLTKTGCNAAACHGSAAGRGGFKLSLFGGDASHDFDEIVHRLEGRRVNLARPSRSLLVLKPTEELEHEGGMRFGFDSQDSKTIQRWIAQGAQREHVRKLVALDVEPNDALLTKTGDSVQLTIRANFDDGTQRDVTSQSIYWPDDEAAVEANGFGKLTAKRRGRHNVVVRYLTIVKTAAVSVPLHDEVIDLSKAPRKNWVDDEILAMLKTLHLPVSAQANDATMLRRLRLDLTGRLPTPDDVSRYIANNDPKKYVKKVDELLQSDEFTDYWTYKLAKLLRIRSKPQESQGARAFHNWVRAQVQQNEPLNDFARTLLTADGDSHTVGPANFHRVASGPREQAEYVSEVLMGVRLRCANCHNHPLDQWTQDDYHGLAAMFARVERGRVVRVSTRGEVTHPRTGTAAIPRIPGDQYLEEDVDGRQALAEWLVDKDNPYFAKAMVNRLWKSLMGRGLIEPADDVRATNPATHPRLLDKLATDFIESGFNLRHTLRVIVTSATYARSSKSTAKNRMDDRFYSHALARPLEAEVLADAIADVTGVPNPYGAQKLGTRAVNLFDSRITSPALDILGRCSREESCEQSGAGGEGGITKMLHFINGDLLNKKITSKAGHLQRWIATGQSNDEIVAKFYLQAFGRKPTSREQSLWKKELATDNENERRERLEDFVWSLLSSREFATNH